MPTTEDTSGSDELELETKRHEARSGGTTGGVVVERDAPDSTLPDTDAPDTEPVHPGDNDTIQPGVLSAPERRDAARDVNLAGEPPMESARARLPVGLLGLLAGLVVVVALVGAGVTARARGRAP